MPGFSNTLALLMQTGITSASFDNDPPYELGWAATGSINFALNNWGNTDNTLTVDVYWGGLVKGQFPKNTNINWSKDLALSGRTFSAFAGTTTNVVGTIDVPRVKGRFMKLTFTLAGTAKTVDAEVWFHGRDNGASDIETMWKTVYQNFGSSVTAVAKNTEGRVLALRATNTNAAVRYFQLFNSASTPTTGVTASTYSFIIPAGTATAPATMDLGEEFWGKFGQYFDQGITYGWSTTASTYTAATAADHTTTIVRL